MTEKQIFFFCLAGFLFVSVFGALSRFFYEWSGKKRLAGVLFASNESTWEHLKLAIFPTLVFFFVGLFFLDAENRAVAFFLTLFTPMVLIPVIFYSYTALTGQPKLAVDILTYFFSVAIAFGLCYRMLTAEPLPKFCSLLAAGGIVLIVFCYLTFTVMPPENFLFRDERTGRYGPG